MLQVRVPTHIQDEDSCGRAPIQAWPFETGEAGVAAHANQSRAAQVGTHLQITGQNDIETGVIEASAGNHNEMVNITGSQAGFAQGPTNSCFRQGSGSLHVKIVASFGAGLSPKIGVGQNTVAVQFSRTKTPERGCYVGREPDRNILC